jgi:hypothetical protein
MVTIDKTNIGFRVGSTLSARTDAIMVSPVEH